MQVAVHSTGKMQRLSNDVRGRSVSRLTQPTASKYLHGIRCACLKNRCGYARTPRHEILQKAFCSSEISGEHSPLSRYSSGGGRQTAIVAVAVSSLVQCQGCKEDSESGQTHKTPWGEGVESCLQVSDIAACRPLLDSFFRAFCPPGGPPREGP